MTEYEIANLRLQCIIAEGLNHLAARGSLQPGKDDWGRGRYESNNSMIVEIHELLEAEENLAAAIPKPPHKVPRDFPLKSKGDEPLTLFMEKMPDEATQFSGMGHRESGYLP